MKAARAAVCLWLAAAACEDTSYRQIGGEINLLTKRDDALVPPSVARLAAFGPRALPQIETALHTASAAGKHHLLAVVERIGSPEGIPVVRHFALYDPDADVRRRCAELLTMWAASSDARGARAQEALGWIARKRAHGEGPVVLAEPR